MNFTWMPTLKNIALVKVTTELWNVCVFEDSVVRSSTGYSDYDYSSESMDCQPIAYEDFVVRSSTGYRDYDYSSESMVCQTIEQKVMEKVRELKLPKMLNNEILAFIQPMGLEIYNWKTYLCENPYLGTLLTAEEYTKFSAPCWTPQGIVDQKKTAEAFINDENLDITKRYILACNFCLEDDIKELWNSLPQTKKEALYNKGRSLCVYSPHILVVLWTYDIKGELTKLNGLFRDGTGRKISAYQFAFHSAALEGNKTATEYFFQKLAPLEREASFDWYDAKYITNWNNDLFPRSRPLYGGVFVYLLSQMNEEQQAKVLEGSPLEVLLFLLDWPWQIFFMEAANRTWNFLSEQDYVSILRNVLKKINVGFKDCSYQKIFEEFWKQGPSTCKKYFIDRCASDEWLLRDLIFSPEGKENIRLILKDASVKEREKIIFQEGKNICRCLLPFDKWDLLKFFVQECLSSAPIMIKFKEEFEHHINYLSWESSELENCPKFFRFINGIIRKNNKRSIEDGTSSPAKRLSKYVNGEIA